MKTNKIRNKDNSISEYGFMCGYEEGVNNGGIELKLYLEHSIYHVTAINTDYPIRKDCKIWETFKNLTEARKKYNELRKAFYI